MKKSRKLSFDVMLNGRFIKTYKIDQTPFVVRESELRKFVEERIPTLKGKDYKIEIN